jgi:hypothetical protein
VVLRVDEVERLGQADVVVECCDISFELSSSSGWTMLVSRLQMDLNYGDLFLDGWIILVLDGPYLLAVFLMISFENMMRLIKEHCKCCMKVQHQLRLLQMQLSIV